MESEYLEIDFDQLMFWDKSPRIPLTVQSMPLESTAIYFLFNQMLEPLCNSLIQLGWFPIEPLNVIASYCKTEFIIRDGNRRYFACWLLLNSDNPICPPHIRKIALAMTEEQKERLKKVYVITI